MRFLEGRTTREDRCQKRVVTSANPLKLRTDMERPSEWPTKWEEGWLTLGLSEKRNCVRGKPVSNCLRTGWMMSTEQNWNMSTLQMNRRAQRNVAAWKVWKASVEVGRTKRQKWDCKREEDYWENTWWRWQWWQREPWWREELTEAI